MKKVFIVANNLFTSLLLSPTHDPIVATTSFAIPVWFLGKDKKEEGKLLLHTRNEVPDPAKNRSLCFFTGTFSVEGCEPCLCTGVCEQGEHYEDCYILLAEQAYVHTSNISKQDFVGYVRRYCESRHIRIDETGNAIEGFPLFENIPDDPNAPPPTLKDRNNADIELYTLLYKNFFPVTIRNAGVEETHFGTFISDNEVRIYTRKEAFLLGLEHLIVSYHEQ